jgi:hypothetical protein
MKNSDPHKKRGGWKQTDYQKEISRKLMFKLRQEQPEKFVRRKPKVAAETSAAPVQSPPASAPPVQTPPSKPVQSPPQTMPGATPVPTTPEIKPDTTLFGAEEVQPPKIDGGNTPPPVGAPPGTPGSGSPGEPQGAPPESVKKYAVIVWGMIVKICTTIFGDGFKPIILKSETGEVLYDENAEGVKVWWNWLVSIGVRAFSPLVELWIFMIAYFTIRFPLIVARFRKKKGSAGQPAPTGTEPQAGPETQRRPAPDKPQATETPPSTTPKPPPPKEPPQATEQELADAGEQFR